MIFRLIKITVIKNNDYRIQNYSRSETVEYNIAITNNCFKKKPI